MGQIRSFDEALDFYPTAKPTLGSRFAAAISGIRLVWDAFLEGRAAADHYQQLRARGLSHDAAASKVFGAHFG